MKKIFLVLITGMLMITSLIASDNNIEMPAIFSDNMVLQQKAKVPFWGKAKPDLEVKIQATWGASAKTEVTSDGLWQANLKTPKAGGPYDVQIQIGDTTLNYKNVLIGEVWLCSGQSNMEMPLTGWPPNDLIVGSEEAIKTADYPNIRLFTVTRAFAAEPKFNCEGSWQECSPATAAPFSATAFFFGRKLYEELKIPIGLIHSSWGGTPAEAWTNKQFLASMEDFTSILNSLDSCKIEIKKLNEWLFSKPVIDVSEKPLETKWKNLDFRDAQCSRPDFDDSRWKEMNLPRLWEISEVGAFDGVIWFRRKIEIPKSWLNQDLILELGPIDDMDITCVNGVQIGSYEAEGFYLKERIYTIPQTLVTDTLLTIAVRVIDNQGGGGLFGAPNKLKIQPANSDEKISLAGNWKYLAVAEYFAGKFYVFGAEGEKSHSRPKLSVDFSANTPTTLYNGMIHPLILFAIKGAIWYQGESNQSRAEQYQILFPTMINNWRADWNQGDFPFYFVQIAPYNYGPASESQRLREAQFLTLKTPKTGMAVTLDIGNPANIHPGNKKDVGERLARWALAKDYKKKVVCSGPLYKKMKVKSDKIILSFDYANDGLVVKEIDGQNNFLIAGEDSVFRKADVVVDGKKLIVSNPEIAKPVAVRYTWGNITEGTLFNSAGLPASTFRTDDWQK